MYIKEIKHEYYILIITMNERPQDEASGDVIQQPQPAHIREEYESEDDLLEATELRPVSQDGKFALPRLSHILSPGLPMAHWHDPIRRFWRHNIRIEVPHEDCRDHLGK